MKNSTEITINKEIYYQILKNISPSAYILCAKCNASKIDALELSEFLLKFIDQYLYGDNENGYVELAEIMDTILNDILEAAPYDLDQKSLSQWHLENKKRLFGRRYEEGDLLSDEEEFQYLVYDSVTFYQNIECDCYLKKNIDQKSIYRVKVE